MIDYSKLGIPKTRPRKLDKDDTAAAVDAKDRAERKKCHTRSGGQCEVIEMHSNSWNPGKSWTLKRCARRASQNHHLIGGIGRRNKGKSLLAAHRIDVCDRCHDDITGNVLQPHNEAERYDAKTVKYERVR